MMRNLFAAATLLVGLLFAAPLEAALIPVDLLATGDGLITRDTAQGLDFVDIDQTLGLSFNQIAAGAGGWTTNGFRYATLNEVETLLLSLGFFNFTADAQGAQFAPSQDFINLFGCTEFCDGPNDRNADADAILDAETAFIGLMEMTIRDNFDFARTRVFLGESTLTKDFSDPGVGNFLVRASPTSVPEPGTAALLLAALAGFAAIRRRQ